MGGVFLKLIDLMKEIKSHTKIDKNKTRVISFNSSVESIILNDDEDKLYLERNGKIIGYVDVELLRYIKKHINFVFPKILENIKEGVIAIDESGRIFYVNKKYTDILKVPINRVIGKYIHDIEKDASIINVLNTKKSLYRENNYIKSLNKYVNVNIFPLYIDGEFKGACSVFDDVTKINNLNKKISIISKKVDTSDRILEAQSKLLELKIIGEDINFLNLISKALLVAQTDAPVLLIGEMGSGKDLISRFIHKNSKRFNADYVSLNCSAIVDSLIESEMFGYEEGSFTGAKKGGKKGKFELANKGTLFLDEIGDMSIAMQPKLLRALELGEIEKIGSEKKIDVDVRIISATNQNLYKKMKEGKFREDLFYRLSVVVLEIPPLRERGLDSFLFINHYLENYNKKYNKDLTISNEAYNYLMSYSWPGNIRELKNVIEYSVIICQNNMITIKELPENIVSKNDNNSSIRNLEYIMDSYESKVIKYVLNKHNKNIEATIKELDISERTLYRKLKKYNIDLTKLS